MCKEKRKRNYCTILLDAGTKYVCLCNVCILNFLLCSICAWVFCLLLLFPFILFRSPSSAGRHTHTYTRTFHNFGHIERQCGSAVTLRSVRSMPKSTYDWTVQSHQHHPYWKKIKTNQISLKSVDSFLLLLLFNIEWNTWIWTFDVFHHLCFLSAV